MFCTKAHIPHQLLRLVLVSLKYSVDCWPILVGINLKKLLSWLLINSGREYWPESTKKTNMDRLHNWLRDHLNQSKTLHVSQDLLNVCRLAQYWSYCQHDPHRCRLTNPGSKSKFIQKELLQHACLQSYQWTLGIQRILPRRPPSKVQDLMKTLKELDHIQLCGIRYSGYEYSRQMEN